ncbi:MAG: hypothetical protein IT260_01545 [Saprospiraceae bacterium]|nr:hypothetical protein [Saprospiraceae bacterium]
MPWNWIYDGNIFGVETLNNEVTQYCCVRSAASEVFALGTYLDDEGLQSYLNFVYTAEKSENEIFIAMLRQRLLKVEFADGGEMSAPELKHIKGLGLKFRGQRQWVKAEGYRPGYLPNLISVEQVALAIHVLQQAMVVTKQWQQVPEQMERSTTELLLRRPILIDGHLKWVEAWRPFPEREVVNEPFPLTRSRATVLKRELKRSSGTVLFSFQYLSITVAEPRSRAFFALNAILVDFEYDTIIGFDLFRPENLRSAFEDNLYQQFRNQKAISEQIVVDSKFVESALESYCEALGIELIDDPEIPVFQSITNMLRSQLGG